METSHTMAWIGSAVLATYGGGCIAANYATVILWYARRKRGSLLPLMGGLAFPLAMLFCPLPGVRLWAWIPLVADLGCVFLFGGYLYGYLFKRRGVKDVA